MKEEKKVKNYPDKLNYYKVEIENFEIRGARGDKYYFVHRLWEHVNTALKLFRQKLYQRLAKKRYIKNGNVKINEINYVKFLNNEGKYSEIIPTLVYVENCYDKDKISYLFLAMMLYKN